jgi:zinc/manganese transport system substrate-binding protein
MTTSRFLMRLGLRMRLVSALAMLALVGSACGVGANSPAPGADSPEPGDERPAVVVTHAVLGAVVRELVGEMADVTVLMANGVDPHDWSPSARDIETLNNADLVVANGLDLEEGLIRALEEAEATGVPVFHATDHVTVRQIGEDEHEGEEGEDEHEGEEGEDEHGHEGGDPHFWVDPIAMKAVVTALGGSLSTEVGLDVSQRQAALEDALDELDTEVRTMLDAVPAASRKLVTGHESLGYFADRYGFSLVGAVIPGLTTQGEVSAGELSGLKSEIEEQQVPAIFTEVGTPAAVVDAIARETGVEVVELHTITLPDDGSYLTFVRELAREVADALA